MMYRSWLVVPAHSEKRLGRAVGSGADVVVLDLVAGDPLAERRGARQLAAEWLEVHRSQIVEHPFARWVRINPLDAGAEWRQDLLAVMPSAPDGIILPRAAGPEAVRQLAAELYEIEQRVHVPANSTRIVPMVAETAASALTTTQYVGNGHQRILGFGWSPDQLAIDIGATRVADDKGESADTFRFSRAQSLLTAHACGYLAIETAPAAASKDESVSEAASRARADGFSGMFASRSGQIAAINEAFTPSDDELRDARDIIAAFQSHQAGMAATFQGQSIPESNLRLAQRTLGQEQGPTHSQLDRRPTLRPA